MIDVILVWVTRRSSRNGRKPASATDGRRKSECRVERQNENYPKWGINKLDYFLCGQTHIYATLNSTSSVVSRAESVR